MKLVEFVEINLSEYINVWNEMNIIKSILRKKPIIHKWIKRRKRKEIFNVNYLIIRAWRWVNENQNVGLSVSSSSLTTCEKVAYGIFE